MSSRLPQRLALWLPLAVFLGFVLVVVFGLGRSPEVVLESKLIGKAMPQFTLPGALPGRPGLADADFKTGRPVLLNIFASWCVPCAAEAPQLMALKRAGATIHAIAIRDTGEAVGGFLRRNGDPFGKVGFDDRSRVQLALGSSGVPETFIVDGKGVIRYQHIGDIRPEQVATILSQLEKAR